MASNAYEILALFMRYVFVLLGACFLLGIVRVLLRDRLHYQKEMKRLPDAGLVGKMVDLDSGQTFMLPREGLIGTSKQSDVRLSGQGLLPQEARFAFVDGKGLKIVPEKGREVLLDGVPIEGSAYALNGSEIAIGNTLFSLHMLSGLPVPQGRRASMPEVMPGSEWTEIVPLPEDRIEGYAADDVTARDMRPFDERRKGE